MTLTENEAVVLFMQSKCFIHNKRIEMYAAGWRYTATCNKTTLQRDRTATNESCRQLQSIK